MNRAFLLPGAIALLTVTGCNSGSSQPAQKQNSAVTAKRPKLSPADLPPAIVRSPAYRCTDGKALYVDVLQDKRAVLVRDSRADVPVRLERQTDSGLLTGNGVSLSGTGKEVHYSSPDRPSQVCNEAAG